MASRKLELIYPLLEFAQGVPVRVWHGRAARSLEEVARWVAQQGASYTAGYLKRLFRRYSEHGLAGLERTPYKNRGKSEHFGRAPQSIPESGEFEGLTEAGKYLAGLYLRDNLSFLACHEAVLREQARFDWQHPPSYSAVRRWLRSWPKVVRDYARMTLQQWSNAHRPYATRDYRSIGVHDWWNLDHGQFDFWAYNCFLEEWGRYVFPDAEPNAPLRMYLTAVQDVRSRRIVGYAFSVNPGSTAIMSAVNMAVRETGTAPRCGLTDRGKDFLKTTAKGEGARIEGALWRLIRTFHGEQGRVVAAIGRNPQSKPVERFFGTMRSRLDELVHSRCGNAPHRRPDLAEELRARHLAWVKEGAQGVSPALPGADVAIGAFIGWLGWYHGQHRHRGHAMDRRTAEQVYRAGWPLQQEQAARAALDLKLLEEFLWNRQPCAVRRGRVRLLGQDYEPADGESRARLLAWDGDPRKVEVACDPNQPDYAVAFDPETGERLGALEGARRFAWGEPQENIKAHLRARGKPRRAVGRMVGQLPQHATAEQPFAAVLAATGTEGAAGLVVPSPRVLRAKAERAEQKQLSSQYAESFVEKFRESE
jgi:hypothetical protein